MIYRFSAPQPHHHYLHIEWSIPKVNRGKIRVALPAWRPGRYELANYAKNLRGFKASDETGNPMSFQKVDKDTWEIQVEKSGTVTVSYDYFAHVLDAGSSYLNEDQIYVNPVNCCCYLPERMNEAVTVEIDLPDDFEVATAMKRINEYTFSVRDFQELADSPFIASPSLQHDTFECENTTFHLWFQGEVKPNWATLKDQFCRFAQLQYNLVGEFPFEEYHFLFQITPFRSYHGVEHQNSTVILLGASWEVMSGRMYQELLGVSSHELFHTWNVKAIRPVEMYPYDFSQENYTKLGYVTEGLTTYYGDLTLLRSEVYDLDRYFLTFRSLLIRHFHNFGHRHLSVADSSFDTWLDGYKKEAPNRSVSIYTEGALVSFLLDVHIMHATQFNQSMDSVLKGLYLNYAKKGKGYSEKDYQQLLESVSGTELSSFYSKYINGTEDFLPAIQSALDLLGIDLKIEPGKKFTSARLGFKVKDGDEITDIYPESPADLCGLRPGDKVQSVNGFDSVGHLQEWCEYFQEEMIRLGVLRDGRILHVVMSPGEETYYQDYKLSLLESPSPEQKAAFDYWSGSRS